MLEAHAIDRYVNAFRHRLRRLAAVRGAAAIAAAATLITVVAVAAGVRTGFPAELVVGARLLLVGVIAALAWVLVVRPGRRIAADGAADIEARAPDFGGRIETYLETDGTANPMRPLLADDALAVASRNPPDQRVPGREFAGAIGVAALAAGILVYLAAAGPGNYAWGVRQIWFGWAVPGLVPPQSIAVEPGDEGVRMGGSVRVAARTLGFAPGRADVHVSFDGGDWQRVDMAGSGDEFEFTFFSVRAPMRYYVAAAGVRSPTYDIRVVDLPNVDRIVNTLRFPDWTRRDPETRDPGGDVRSIAGTSVDVSVHADGPMPPAALVVDGRQVPLDVEAATARGSFEVTGDGEYYVAAVVGGEAIRLTDDYFITVVEDEAPTISFERPGRDWNASPVEEVTASLRAEDDYGIDRLELRYSVNGGEWQSVPFAAAAPAIDAEHVFFLESLGAGQTEEDALVPGDLVSYYAVAADRESETRTDMFFVQVQPFDRRYTQSQQSGGGGMQGGNPQDEISARQREIIVSTWNLIREQQEQKRGDPGWVPNNAALLSRLQTTLKEQAETLAARTEARQLVGDEQIAQFIEHLRLAAEAMQPAADRLAEIDLEEALQPEQEALQHLLRAESVFTDISLSLQANSGGGGGQAGRDLTDMFALEMDLEKNQYETGSRATPDAPQDTLDEVRDELEELARRQEQLARNLQSTQTPTPAQRWQQEMLRRDVEELRDRLERMQADSRDARSGQPRDGSSSASGGDSGSEREGSEGGERSERQLDELGRRLESAVRAMNEVDEAMRDRADRQSLERAAGEARRQLEGARDQAAAERDRLMQAALDELADRAGDLHERQAAIDEQLQDAVRSALAGTGDDGRLESGMTFQEEYEMAEAKRRLQAELQRLGQDVKQAALDTRDTNRDAAEQLERALERLRDDEVEERLAVSAAYVEQGEAVYVSGSESAITEALRDFEQDLARAATMAGEPRPGDAGGAEPLDRALADTRELRRELARMSAEAVPGGDGWRRGRDDLQQTTGIRVPDLETRQRLERGLQDVSDDVLNLFRNLRADGVPPQTIDELRRLAADVRAADFSGNPELIDRELQRSLDLVEQLELALAATEGGRRGPVRAVPPEEIPESLRENVATYYRRLGEADEDVED